MFSFDFCSSSWCKSEFPCFLDPWHFSFFFFGKSSCQVCTNIWTYFPNRAITCIILYCVLICCIKLYFMCALASIPEFTTSGWKIRNNYRCLLICGIHGVQLYCWRTFTQVPCQNLSYWFFFFYSLLPWTNTP